MSRRVVSAEVARALLLSSHGLLGDPARRAGPKSVLQQIERMGFVQVDTISVVERAHHHILMSRFDGYRPDMLTRLLERDRTLFEHWTHDASVIPTKWFPYWKRRFRHWETVIRSRWWPRWSRRLGDDPEALIRAVKRRIQREGPLSSRAFEDDRPHQGTFWNWKPSRAALEYLWRTGELTVTRRDGFVKVYDLTKRVFPELVGGRMPARAAYVDWACRFSLERLGVATPREIAQHLLAVPLADVKDWAARAARRGDVEAVAAESIGGAGTRDALALPDWERRARRAGASPDRMRILSPFDPVIHDRDRTLRLFDFDYRLECFVPAKKRQYGYYVMPLLEGDRLVGRVDPKLDRAARRLGVRGPWWEPGVRPTRARRRLLSEALDRFAAQVGADDWRLAKPTALRCAPGGSG